MNIMSKYVFLGVLSLNSAILPNSAAFKKALDPENIDKFKDEMCYALKNEADIQTCAMVKLFMAQALKDSYEPRNVATVGSVLVGFLLAGTPVGLVLGTKTNSPVVAVTGGFVSGLIGAFIGEYLHHRLGSDDQQAATAFTAYFNRLLEHPVIVERDFVLANRDDINKIDEIEKRFKKLSEKHNLIETSPVFEQYRRTRSVISEVSDSGSALFEKESK